MADTELDPSVPVRDIEIFSDIRNYTRKKINNFEDNSYAAQRTEVLKIIKRSIETKESNSAVICGAPGCGKTSLLNNVLKQLTVEDVINNESAVVVKLNGLLHTNDRLALQAIREELNVIGPDDNKIFSNFQENLMYLLDKMKGNNLKNKSFNPCIIFILEEFHMFCDHKNQILLYNLFDLSQSAKVPVCIIGLTFHTDVMDRMEKRVFSRFFPRIIWMVDSVKVEERLKLFHNIFTVFPNDLPNVDEIYKFIWNKRTEDLVENKEVHEGIRKYLEIDSSQTNFRNRLHKLCNTITFEFPLLTVENIKNVFAVLDSYVPLLMGLSLLEMALLIAVKHHYVHYEREPFNFEMMYNQYLKFCNRNATNLVTERSVMLKAFQRLQELEIILPLRKTMGKALGKVPLEYQLYNLNLTQEQIMEGVKLNKDLTPELRQWASFTV